MISLWRRLLLSGLVLASADPLIGADAKLTASDAASGDEFGYSVDVSGDTVVVGARFDDDGGFSSGSAYVYQRAGGAWPEIAKLIPSSHADYDFFGRSVAINGDTIVVGASQGGGDVGKAFVFHRESGVWTEQTALVPDDSTLRVVAFGDAVDVEGDVAVIGAPASEVSFTPTGSAYVFRRVGTVWTQEAILAPSVDILQDRFGSAVAISGSTIVVGADEYLMGQGAVYVFELVGGNWTQTAKVTPISAHFHARFGFTVDVDVDTLIVGAPDDYHTNGSGAAFVFERTGGSWTEKAKLLASDAPYVTRFGWSVGVVGSRLVIGALGRSVYLFTPAGAGWREEVKWEIDTFDFAQTLAIEQVDDLLTVVAGAPGEDLAGYHSGSAYVFERNATFLGCDSKVADGGFELGIPNPVWGEFSLNFSTPLCSFGRCGNGAGTAGPRNGSYWSWFGGSNRLEQSILTQGVTFPTENATLVFYLWIGASSGNNADYLNALVDGVLVFSVKEGTPPYTSGYKRVAVDVSDFADGSLHTIRLESTTYAPGVTNFSVDDVSLLTCPPPRVSLEPAETVEGDDGTSECVFEIALSHPSPVPITIDFNTSNDTATAGADYLAALGTLHVDAGKTSTSISVTALGDLIYEGDETFLLQLGGGSGVVLPASPEAVGTIFDDDSAGLSIAPAAVAEPTSGSTPMLFHVSLSPSAASTVTVDFITMDGTATSAEGDYVATSGMLTFPAGTTVQPLPVLVNADANLEVPESFVVDLTGASGAAIAHPEATGTIIDQGFYSITPCRVIDTRTAVSHLGGPVLVTGASRAFRIAGNCGIPEWARAVSVNVTVSESTAPGHLRLFAAGDPVPTVSSINYAAGQTLANNAVVPLNEMGELAVFVGGANGTVHFILDVNGFFP